MDFFVYLLKDSRGEHLLWREGADNRAGKRDDFSEHILGRRLRVQKYKISCCTRDFRHLICKIRTAVQK